MNYSEAKINPMQLALNHADQACTQNIVCINSFLGKFDYNNIAGPRTEAPYTFALLGHTDVYYKLQVYYLSKLLRN